MLVSPKVRFRWTNQLSPATAVTEAVCACIMHPARSTDANQYRNKFCISALPLPSASEANETNLRLQGKRVVSRLSGRCEILETSYCQRVVAKLCRVRPRKFGACSLRRRVGRSLEYVVTAGRSGNETPISEK